MPNAQPTHFVSGLQGGYVPNVVDHYDTKRDALSALAYWAETERDFYWDAPDEGPHGNVRPDGFFKARKGHFDGEFYDYAMIEPCMDPELCEADNEEGWL